MAENNEENVNSNLPQTGAEELDPLLMMEDVLEKLKVLNYENAFLKVKGHKPLSRTYFAIKSTNQGEQFIYFSSLSFWLFSLCGVNMGSDKKYDDPNTTAQNILNELKKFKIDIDVQPNKLRTGYGDGICLVLLKLVEKAIEKKGLKVKEPVIDNDEDNNDNDGNQVEMEEAENNMLNMEIDFGDNNNAKEDQQEKEEEGNEEASNILHSRVTPEEWQREVEKVSAKLKPENLNMNYAAGEWRGHIDQIKNYNTAFTKSIPDTRNILEKLSEDMEKILERISKKENLISKNFSNITSEYKGVQKNFNDQRIQMTDLENKLLKLNREYEIIDEKVNEANSKHEELKKKISDTNNLAAIKQTIQKLNAENLSLDIKIGIINHSILKHKLNTNHNYNHIDGIDTQDFDEVL